MQKKIDFVLVVSLLYDFLDHNDSDIRMILILRAYSVDRITPIL